MQNIIIDEEFKGLLPALSTETYALLEANLLENGCRDVLVLWNGILIDGYNRYEICTKHGIPFDTVDKGFSTRDEVMIWIISTQVSRRNLTPIQLGYYRGKHYNVEKKSQSLNSRYAQQNANGQNVRLQNTLENTAARLGDKYHVTEKTIRRDSKFATAVDAIGETSPEAKLKILAGEANISKWELEDLSGKPTEEITAAAAQIEDGEYGKKKQADRELARQEQPAGAILAGMAALDKAISKLVDGFYAQLPKITTKGDRSELKASLRSCIDKLEELHKTI